MVKIKCIDYGFECDFEIEVGLSRFVRTVRHAHGPNTWNQLPERVPDDNADQQIKQEMINLKWTAISCTRNTR